MVQNRGRPKSEIFRLSAFCHFLVPKIPGPENFQISGPKKITSFHPEDGSEPPPGQALIAENSFVGITSVFFLVVFYTLSYMLANF